MNPHNIMFMQIERTKIQIVLILGIVVTVAVGVFLFMKPNESETAPRIPASVVYRMERYANPNFHGYNDMRIVALDTEKENKVILLPSMRAVFSEFQDNESRDLYFVSTSTDRSKLFFFDIVLESESGFLGIVTFDVRARTFSRLPFEFQRSSVEVSPDGQRIAGVSYDESEDYAHMGNTVYIYDLNSEKIVSSIKLPLEETALSWSYLPFFPYVKWIDGETVEYTVYKRPENPETATYENPLGKRTLRVE